MIQRATISSSSLVVILLLLLNFCSSNPVFHKVNDLDVFGNTCPLQPNRKAKCPAICVQDRSNCPTRLQEDCPAGTQLCDDGECKQSCKYIHNVCACGTGSEEYKPCRVDITVAIDEFDPSNKAFQITEKCISEFDLGGNLTVWQESGNGERFWGICPKRAPTRFSYTEPMWIAVFSIFGFEFLIFILWSLYKKVAERNVIRLMASDAVTQPMSERLNNEKKATDNPSPDSSAISKENGFHIKGFANNLFGTFIVYNIGLISVGWIIYLSIIVADYYGEITGFNYGIAYEDYDNSSVMFICVWIAAVSWFFILNVFLPRLRNYFRLEVNPLDANFIQIEQPTHTNFLLDDSSALLMTVRQVESRLKAVFGWDKRVTTVPLQRTNAGLFFFSYHCTRYVYSDAGRQFTPFDFDLGGNGSELLRNKDGLTKKEAIRRLELKGPNFISVAVPSFPIALAQEFTSFFYLYQLSIMWLFYYLAYYVVGVVDTVVIIISAVIKTVIRLKSEKRIKEMAEHKAQVMVFRDKEWIKTTSDDLVPGDVIQIEHGTLVPCDAIVLSGNIVADESCLTGEPLPIRKFPVKEETVVYDRLGTHKINSLFAGTTVAQANPVEGDDYVRALVYQTSTSTDKGQLVHNILFPQAISFIFDEQLKVVLCVLCIWGIVLFGLSLWWMSSGGTASWFYGMFCLSQVISPLLPAALVVGQSTAAARLRDKKIFCVDLPRIMISGKVQMFCFDKTGTLTKEGLEFYGGQPTNTITTYNKESELDPSFQPFNDSFDGLPSLLQLGVATCHAVTKVGEQMIGNPVDIEMFSATNWSIHAPEGPNYVDTLKSKDSSRVAHIVKRYEFVHARQSMSVAVLDPVTQHVHVFVKGSFEKVKDLANSESLPEDYDLATSKLAMEGCYVLTMAHRDLGKIDPETVRSWTREQMEESINLIGLVVFKNKLKEDTRDAILELKSGATRTIMITGDTALTGIYIARACGMMEPEHQVYLADINKQGDIEWVDVDQSTNNVNNVSRYTTDHILSLIPKDGLGTDIELAVTGKAFRKLCSQDVIRRILLNTRVFARMLPQDKVDCVELHMERGITAMCGDGGNDCGALRAAHVGIALSEAEASIVSPFSSSFRSVQSCVELIKQGRAALATSFAGYKYLIMYGEIMACLKIISFYFSIQVSAPNWVLIDLFITITMSYAIAQAQPSPYLLPSRPTSRILGPETMVSTLGQVAINFAYVFGSYGMLFKEEFFKCREFDSSAVDLTKWYLLGDNYEASMLAFVTLYQFVNAAAVFNFGFRYRQTFLKNYTLIICWSLLFTYISIMLLADPNWLGCIMRLNCGDPDVLLKENYTVPLHINITPYNILSGSNVFPRAFRWKLFGLCIANIITGLAFERLVVLGPVRDWARKKFPLKRLQLKR